MKAILLASLIVSASAFAETVTLVEKNGKATLDISSVAQTTTASEIVGLISRAHKKGLQDANGKDIFIKKGTGGMGRVSYTSKLITVTHTSGMTFTDSVEIKTTKKTESITLIDKKTIEVKGAAANLLKDALVATEDVDTNGPVGSFKIESKSGNISCSHAVVRRPVSTCIIKLSK